jgi:hypothetical protein
MDYGDLAAKVKLIAIDKMGYAEMFAQNGSKSWNKNRRLNPQKGPGRAANPIHLLFRC